MFYLNIKINCFLVLILSFLLWILFGKNWISFLRKRFKNGTREYLDQHQIKSNTPTMGGLFILFSTIFSTIFFVKINIYVLLFFLVSILFALIGLLDDYYKVTYKKGLSSSSKAILQLIAAVFFGLIYLKLTNYNTINIKMFGIDKLNSSVLFLFWIILILVGTTNAVNITDGLDGLAASTIMPVIFFFSFACLVSSSELINQLAVCGFSLIGSCLGFLYFNKYPAKVFMGDVGSLFLGAAISFLAICSKKEILLLIVAGVFVLETLSVIIQVLFFKFFRKRIFKMAPFHHHLELIGWSEVKIVILFTILSLALMLLSLLFAI